MKGMFRIAQCLLRASSKLKTVLIVGCGQGFSKNIVRMSKNTLENIHYSQAN